MPLGVGAHLRAWGIPEQRVVELDWNQSSKVDDLTVICLPARHFSGRLFNRNNTLWASWGLIGPSHRAYFGGDTGYTKSFAQIGADHGPFDLTLLPIGAYNPAFTDVHMNPEEAVQAHLDVTSSGSGLLVPIHWGTFRLAPHPWAEPVERLLSAADAEHVQVAVPTPGQRVDPAAPLRFEPVVAGLIRWPLSPTGAKRSTCSVTGLKFGHDETSGKGRCRGGFASVGGCGSAQPIVEPTARLV